MLAEANAVIETVSVQDRLYYLEDAGAVLVDVRETVERESGLGDDFDKSAEDALDNLF